MNAFWIGAGVVGLSVVLVAWLKRVQRVNAQGKAPMSPKWLVENAYDREGDWWGKGK